MARNDQRKSQPTPLFDFVCWGRDKAVASAVPTEAVQGAVNALPLQESLSHVLSRSPSPVPGASPKEGFSP